MKTLDEIRELVLTRVETCDILSLLAIDAEELLDRFEDKLMTHQDELEEALSELS